MSSAPDFNMPDGTLRRMLLRSLAPCALFALVLLTLGGCSSVGYYSQAIGGHLKLMRARQPIAELLSNEDLDPALREKLQTLVDARQFAVNELLLPDNDSYSTYVETGRNAVTWNVVAADEFSVNAHTWCFPVAGCVSYKGYFDEADAHAYAATLAAEGMDVTVGGASAYSTLGWFADPVLDTMLRGGDTRFVGTLFHELAHQLLYVKNDSNFNEAFANFVEQAGLQRWLNQRGESERITQLDASQRRGNDFVELLKDTRTELVSLYDSDLSEDAMRTAKQAVFDRMRERYASLKVSWDGYSGYDGWFSRDLNNARLVAVSTYRRYMPAFAAMFVEAGEDFASFYTLAKTVADLAPDARTQRLERYLADDVAAAGQGCCG